MATKKKTNTRDAPVIDYAPRTNDAVYLAKAIGEVLTLPETDRTRLQLYLRKLIEVIEQGSGQPLYKHNIEIVVYRAAGYIYAYLSLYSAKDTPYTYDELFLVFKNEGPLSISQAITSVTGFIPNGSTTTPIYGVTYLTGSDTIKFSGTDIVIEKSNSGIHDKVTQIL